MKRLLLLGISLAVFCGASAARMPNAAKDLLDAPRLRDCRVQGPIGAKLETFMYERCWGPFARGVVMREAEFAFTHPDDDVFNAPVGMWKGEFWGKLMISACRVAEYARDRELQAFLHEEALALVGFQQPDGYLGTYVDKEYIVPLPLEEQKKRVGWACPWNWNLWCRKYTLWGLLACYRLTGDRALLEAADRAMNQQIEMLADLLLQFLDLIRICRHTAYAG